MLNQKPPAKAGGFLQPEAIRGTAIVHFLRGESTLIGMCGAVLTTGRGVSSAARLRIVSSIRKNFSASIAMTSRAKFPLRIG